MLLVEATARRELDDEAVEAHREIDRFAAESGIDLVVAVGGDLAKQLALAAGAAGVPDIAIWSATTPLLPPTSNPSSVPGYRTAPVPYPCP